MNMNAFRILGLLVMTGALMACGTEQDAANISATPAEADAFVAEKNADRRRMNEEEAKAYWLAATYISPDSQFVASKFGEKSLTWMSETIEESKRFNGLELSTPTARAIKLLQTGSTMPAPSDPEKISELAKLAAELEAMYGAGKYCDEAGKCMSLGELENIIDNPDSSYEDKLMAWTGWRTISRPMRDKYARLVELTNEGASELGYSDTGALWRSAYDMPADEFAEETERLWGQVKPLYDALHCYVRDQLAEHYGEDKVPAGQPIPAHLLGNMWSQEWTNIYSLVEPYPGASELDVSSAIAAQRQVKLDELLGELGANPDAADVVAARVAADDYIAREMVKSAENFYASMGMGRLTDSFWENSQFIKPRDRDVVCHASAWDMDMNGDVRIKMCIEPNYEDLSTIYHELGHLYYDLAYNVQQPLFQNAAHDGFHEAIGDTIVLAMTPQYLQSQGLVKSISVDEKAVINNQMKMALERVSFLPFGKLIDQWRWKVFAGEITPENYNAAWWELRRQYQGIEAPVARGEADFDPGAKYHIPSNVPYTRYFLARILQFQFYKSLCDASGYEGPLNQCTFFGSEEAGKRFQAMLEKGASQPWQDTLFELTGTREMDGTPLLEYFAPLMGWLEEQNTDKSCGW